jgi:flagellin FlaB
MRLEKRLLDEAQSGVSRMRKRQTSTFFAAVGRIRNDQSGITGLETAIVLIAFIVVAAVFAFAVLTTGLFTTERAKETTLSALGEAQSTLAPKGAVIGEAAGLTVDTIKFKIANAAGAAAVDLATTRTLLTYSDDNQNINAAPLAAAGDIGACAGAGEKVCWKTNWLIGTGDTIDSGEVVEITVDLLALTTPLSGNMSFKIEVIPVQGAVVPINRTTPLEIKPVMNLD